METETPVARRLGGPGRRPSLGLRPTSGLTERQCAAPLPTPKQLLPCMACMLSDKDSYVPMSWLHMCWPPAQ